MYASRACLLALLPALNICLAMVLDCHGADSIPGNRTLPFAEIICEGAYPKHLQGVCVDTQGNIFWSFTTVLVKTDSAGKRLKEVPADDHHGDLCFVDGKIYVAVNLGKFNQPAGKADSWIYEYDADDLKELARYPVQEAVHGAGGVGFHNGHFIVVGGLPKGVEQNYLFEYDTDWKFVKAHVLPSGTTHLGIQTANFHAGTWWFGCYGTPPALLRASSEYQLEGRTTFDCALGLIGLNDNQFLVGKNSQLKESQLHVGKLVPKTIQELSSTSR